MSAGATPYAPPAGITGNPGATYNHFTRLTSRAGT